MKITRADELCSIVCDKLCKYPLMANSQEQLEEICADCPLEQAMLPEVRSDNNRYERMAGTPERFADTLIRSRTEQISHRCTAARRSAGRCRKSARILPARTRGCGVVSLSG